MSTLANEALSGMIAKLIWLGLLHGAWLGLIAAGAVAVVFQVRWSLSHRSKEATLLAALTLVAVGSAILTACQSFAPSRISGAGLRGSVSVSVTSGAPWKHTSEIAPAQLRSERVLSSSQRFAFVHDLILCVVGLARMARVYALTLWWPVFVMGVTVLALGVRGMNRLSRESLPASRELSDRARRFGRCLRLNPLPTVRVHPRLTEPCLCGLIRQVILLPERWLAVAEPKTIDAVLAHELAHARRRDPLVNLSQRIIEIVFFFHPGVHWLSRSLRRHREHCADALAVRLTGDRLALARALESVACLRVGPRDSRPIVAWLGGEPVSLLPRIQELLGMMPNRPRFHAWPFAAVPAALFLGVVAISVGVAREQVPPPSTIPKAPPVPASRNMITFEVRFVEAIEADAWREGLKGKVQPLSNEAKPSRWIMDQTALNDWLTRAQAMPTTNVIQGPKLTTHENALGTIIRVDHRFDLKGTLDPRDIHVWAEVSKRVLDASRPEALPFNLVSLSKGACDLPDGSSLVVRVERVEQKVGNKTSPRELLVAITPRRIVPDQEQAPAGDEKVIKPAPTPLRR